MVDHEATPLPTPLPALLPIALKEIPVATTHKVPSLPPAAPLLFKKPAKQQHKPAERPQYLFVLPDSSQGFKGIPLIPFTNTRKSSYRRHSDSRSTKHKTRRRDNSKWAPESKLRVTGATGDKPLRPVDVRGKTDASFLVTALGGEQVSLFKQDGRWYAYVTRLLAAGSVPTRRLPVRCQGNADQAIATLRSYDPRWQKHRVRVISSSHGDFLYVGKLGLIGGHEGDKDNHKTTPHREETRQASAAPPTPTQPGRFSSLFSFFSRSKTPPTNNTDTQQRRGGIFSGLTGFFSWNKTATIGTRRHSLLDVGALLEGGTVASTDELIEALNTTPEGDKAALKRWGEVYLQWFEDQSVQNIRKKDLEELAAFARLDPDNETNRDLLMRYLRILCTKIEEQKYGNKDFMQLLDYSLQTIDPAVFSADATLLTRLAQDLLSKLDPKKHHFTAGTFASYEDTLSALHQALILIPRVDPAYKLDVKREDHLYVQFREQLEAIRAAAEYYPFAYRCELILQSLGKLGKPLSKTRERLRKTYHGVRGGYHLYKGVRSLISLDPDGEAFSKIPGDFREVIRSRAIKEEAWYNCLETMAHATALTLDDPTCFDALEAGLEVLRDLKLSKKTRMA
ncbi:MAG: hypothetical protein AAFP88_02155, partial [Bacteroidota bacterium]